MHIRPYRSSDCPALAELFYQTVHTVCARDYSPEQLDAWADGRVELAVDLACQRMTEDELEELKKTQELFAQAIREGDAMRIAQTDERYHEIIYGSTKNEKLVQILNNLREQMYRYRLEYIKDEDKRHILLVEHDQILKALSLRHVHEAKIAIREHIDNQEITILKNLKEQENDVQRKVSGRRNPV